MSKVAIFFIGTIIQIVFLTADPVVQLPNGLIQGREATTLENKTFYVFEKIPYAAPPIGDLRFKAPKPAKDWEGTLDATTLDAICYQTSSDSDFETEDCLFVNVYTTQLSSNDTNVALPVLFFIHGGGFIDGASLGLGPDLFINNDVILVTINYRLGILGFLSTQDAVIPGNNGLKDQHLAIQWAHDNINLFGGDPDKITIFGQSAGSASVAYHLINQKSRDLFRSAICESGSFLSPWAYQRKSREIAFTTAAIIDPTFHTSNDSEALRDFLLSVDAADLDAAASKYQEMESTVDTEIPQGFYWAAVLEVRNPDNAFFTRKMYGLLQAGNIVPVNLLIGMSSEEGLLFTQDAEALKTTVTAYDEHLDWLVPNDMEIEDEDSRVEIGSKIRNIYTGGEPFADHLGDAVRYVSDTSFTRSIIKHAELYSKYAKTYFYQFSYDGLGNSNTHYDGAGNVGHAGELNYLFCGGSGCDFSDYPESDQIASQRLIKIWTDFAKYQNPTHQQSELLQNITWPLVSTEHGDMLYVDINENLVIRNHPKEETYKGWIELYDSLNFTDFYTY